MASVSNEYRYQAISLYKRIDSLLGNEKNNLPYTSTNAAR